MLSRSVDLDKKRRIGIKREETNKCEPQKRGAGKSTRRSWRSWRRKQGRRGNSGAAAASHWPWEGQQRAARRPGRAGAAGGAACSSTKASTPSFSAFYDTAPLQLALCHPSWHIRGRALPWNGFLLVGNRELWGYYGFQAPDVIAEKWLLAPKLDKTRWWWWYWWWEWVWGWLLGGPPVEKQPPRPTLEPGGGGRGAVTPPDTL